MRGARVYTAKLLKDDKLAAEIAPGLYLGSYGVNPRASPHHAHLMVVFWGPEATREAAA